MRQPGPYWIKYHGREWEIAYWYGDFWIMFGLEDYPKKDDELDEIDENRIERRSDFYSIPKSYLDTPNDKP